VTSALSTRQGTTACCCAASRTSFELDWTPAYTEAAQQTLAGTWKETARWRGLGPGGFVRMATQNPALPKAVLDLMADKEKAIVDGKFHPFTGPIKDQSGKQRLAAGVSAPDSQLRGIDWLVEGVQGTLPRG
jgi:basic membrane protein A and related proteins